MTEHNGTWSSLMKRSSEIRELSLSDVRVDMRFQRAVNPNSLKRIKAEYHPLGLGQILVAGVRPLVPGSAPYAIIDGQTRYRALAELIAEQQTNQDIPGLRSTIRAEVFPELTPDEAALLFRLRNTQVTVPPKDRARIGVVEGDPIMLDVNEQCMAAGYVIFSDDEENMPPTIDASGPVIGVAMRLVTWGQKAKRPELLTESLAIQAEAFRTTEAPDLRGTVHPQILQATASLLLKNENLAEGELARVMRTQADLLFDSEKMRDKVKVRMARAIQLVLRDRYNAGKQRADRIKV